jgi:hypothetical protein
MWKGALVGAVALTTGMISLASAETWGTPQEQTRAEAHAGPVITEAHIARLKSALNLTPAQQQYWSPVEAALRQLARRQARGDAGSGMVARVSERAATLAGTAVHLRRLASVAAPLVRALDEGQKREAMSFAHHAGFGQLAAAF